MQVWKRYFFRQIIKNASLFLLLFYGLYVLIDYSSHLSGAHYHHSRLNLKELAIHYLSEFSERASILIPFALLISTVHTLTQLNIHLELVALLAGGFSIHRLLSPFLMAGLAGVFFLYVNNEMILPKALKNISRLDTKYAKQKTKTLGQIQAQHIRLENGTSLIYREFDPASQQFYEVYFLPSLNEVWRMEALDPFISPPKGYAITHFGLKEEVLTYLDSFLSREFPDLVFNEKKLSETLTQPRELPLSELFQNVPQETNALENEKVAKNLTALYQKLALPWLALIAVIGPAPFALRFSRRLPIFLIFSFSIFCLIAIYLVMDAAIMLGERQVLTPATAIFIPMGFFISLFLYRYLKLK